MAPDRNEPDDPAIDKYLENLVLEPKKPAGEEPWGVVLSVEPDGKHGTFELFTMPGVVWHFVATGDNDAEE